MPLKISDAKISSIAPAPADDLLIPAADPRLGAMEGWKDALLSSTRANTLLQLPDEGVVDIGPVSALTEVSNLILVRAKPVSLWDPRAPEFNRAVLQQPGNYQTPPDALQMLRVLHIQTENLIQAQDVSALYMAFGVLTWVDTRSGEAFRSPLLLVPVTLERRGEGASYVLSRGEQGVEVNPLLKHRLLEEGTGFALPPLPEEAYLVVSAYLAKVAALAEERAGWEVEERCILGRFPLLRMRLYEDIAEHEGRVRSHPFVRALAGDTDALHELAAPQPPASDGPPPAPGVPSPFQLLDADPDQERAVQAAVRGQSFILQGPPGTGKTQTITNIIGECLASGKSVLLVSGRVSSLEAVHQRLTEKGLGDLCLTAHSRKTNKRDIFQQLSQSLKPTPALAGPADTAVKLSGKEQQEMETLRGELEAVVHELHRVREPFGLSLYDAYGIVAREEGRDPRRNEWARHFAEGMGDAKDVSRSEYRRREELVSRLTAHPLWARIPDSAVWQGAFTRPLSASAWVGVQQALGNVLGGVYRVLHTAASLSQHCGLEPPQGPGEVDKLLRFARLVLDAPPHCLWLLAEKGDGMTAPARLAQYREQAGQLAARFASLRAAQDLLLERYSGAVLRLPPDESDFLIERLTKRQEGVLFPLLGAGWRDAAVDAANQGGLCETLDALRSLSECLQEEVGSLAASCGVARDNVPKVLAPSDDLQTLLEIATRAAGLPVVCAGWLVSRDAVSRRRQLHEEAQTRWELWKRQTAELSLTYEDGVLALDHADLLASLAATPTGLNRLVNMDALRSRRALQGVRKPGAPAAERDVVADLELARQAGLNRQWCDENAAALAEAFGENYRAGATDWDLLRDSLEVAESLCAASGPDGLLIGNAIGGVPFALASRIAASEPGQTNTLREQAAAITELLREMETLRERLAGSANAVPAPESSFDRVAQWCDAHSHALREQHDAVRTAATLLLSFAATPARQKRDGFPAVAVFVADLENARHLQAAEAELSAESLGLASALCGPFFVGDPVNWEAVGAVIEEAERLHASLTEAGRSAPSDSLRLFAEDADMTAHGALLTEQLTLRQQWGVMSSALAELAARFQPAYTRAGDVSLADIPFADLIAWVEARQVGANQTASTQTLLALRQEYKAQGLAEFFDGLSGRPGEVLPEHIAVSVFRAAFHRAWVEAVAAGVPVLEAFRGAEHSRKIERFCVLDRQFLEGAPGKIRQATKGAKQRLALRNEVDLLSGQLARRRVGEVRSLLAQIPSLLLALKPCVMMNPLSVRLFLDPSAITFDVVLFDDASQVATEEALGAIARGRQVIIAGDSRQLPPMPLMAEVHGVRESILDSANALAAHGSPAFGGIALNWHYRSQHDSLIAYSRRYFYPDLVAFPSASRRSPLEHLVLSGTDETDVRTIMDAVLAYARREPTHSVGIVVLDESDQIRLLDEIIRRKTDAGNDAAEDVKRLSETGSEGFFIKTIENVQGDERDLLLIFVPADPARWGALNRPGARFLLNVAATRARCHMILATSLTAPLAPAGNAQAGGAVLGEFLEVVREEIQGVTGSFGTPYRDETKSAARQLVALTLGEQGYSFDPNVGMPECRVDFALPDLEQPDHYSLGILSDGISYASGGSARHRDRQLPEIMRERGWNLRRVWSQDCYREPEAQRRNIEQVCREATGRERAIAQGEAPTAQQAPTARQAPTAQVEVRTDQRRLRAGIAARRGDAPGEPVGDQQ